MLHVGDRWSDFFGGRPPPGPGQPLVDALASGPLMAPDARSLAAGFDSARDGSRKAPILLRTGIGEADASVLVTVSACAPAAPSGALPAAGVRVADANARADETDPRPLLDDDRRPCVSAYWKAWQERPSYRDALTEHTHPTVARGVERIRSAKAASPALRAALAGGD